MASSTKDSKVVAKDSKKAAKTCQLQKLQTTKKLNKDTERKKKQRQLKAIQGPADAKERIRMKKRKDKQQRQDEVDMLITTMPTAVDATNIMRLLSPRCAAQYTFDPSLTDPGDKYHVNELTSDSHQLL